MRKLVLRAFGSAVGLLALGFAGGVAASEPRGGEGAGIQVTYLANEGFLLESGDTSVLVDALSGDGLPGYPVVPPAIRADLEAARGRFAGVDLVLASHHHGDHFDPAAVARHLRANPGAVFLSTPQAVARLRRELGPAAEGRDLLATYPAEGELAELSPAGIDIAVLNLHHGRYRRPLVENLGLLLRIGGLDVLHVGDTEAVEADLSPYRAPLTEVDVWLLPGWLLDAPAWREARDRSAAGASLVAMHLFAADAPREWFGSAGDLAGQVAGIREAFPRAWVPLEPLATRHFPAP